LQLTKTVKQYRISDISRESWVALDRLFWRDASGSLPKGAAFDDITPERVETTKHGIEVSGTLWTVPVGTSYQATLLLARPRFSSILDFNPKKLDAAKILDCCLEKDGSLSIEVG